MKAGPSSENRYYCAVPSRNETHIELPSVFERVFHLAVVRQRDQHDAIWANSGVLFYLYLTGVSVPILGTNFVETPEVSGFRSAIHFILFLLSVYFGFIKSPSRN